MNVLVVGSGYAGCLLSYFLASNGISVTLVDKNESITSTKVSAGIMLPVTGRRLVKTYMADTIIPFAISTYKKAEQASGIDFFYEKKILQLFNNAGNKNEWFARTNDDDLEGYTADILNPNQIPDCINNQIGGIALLKSGFVDPVLLLTAFNKLHSNLITKVDDCANYSDMKMEPSRISWENISYDVVIFCEGYETIRNPWFKHIPFKPAKGEIINFIAPQLTEEYIINGNIFILPLGKGQFRAGSTYEWHDLSILPTEKGKKELMEALSKLLKCKFDIIDHKAGIRPTIIDRRPVLGFHPENDRIGIFNGLGTKGVMLAPYFAFLMSNYVMDRKKPLPNEIDVNRFNNLLSGL